MILLMAIYCLVFIGVQAINSNNRLQIATHTSDEYPEPNSLIQIYKDFEGIKTKKIEFTPENPTVNGGMESWKVCLIIAGVVIGLCIIVCLWFCIYVCCP